ncbi:MAG: PAQR family membrane homeostasis protein TrhA [Candidatus Dormibacteria bacterium]
MSTSAAVSVKPLLRGWLHAVAAVWAAVGLVVLVVLSRGDITKLVTLSIYGVALVLLFGVSAVYHIPNWSPPRRRVLRRIDHANIFLLTAGTYTPVATVLLRGGFRVGILVAIWSVSAAGIVLTAGLIPSHRRLLALIYVASGWIAVFVGPQLIAAGGTATLLLLAGGVLYSLGALAYALKRPQIIPRVFGYHEVFHLAVVAASVCFYVFMLVAVVPH